MDASLKKLTMEPLRENWSYTTESVDPPDVKDCQRRALVPVGSHLESNVPAQAHRLC